MSAPPYMPWWIADYLRDTQHLDGEKHGAYLLLIAHCWMHDRLPADDEDLALIARIPIKRWRAMKATILAFFQPDGTHKRVIKERARVQHLNTVRSKAGYIGGLRSAASKKLSKSRSPPQANRPPNPQTKSTANAQQKSSAAEAYQTQNQNLSESHNLEAARASNGEMPKDQQHNPASSSTTSPARAPDSTSPPNTKPPTEWTREDLEKSFAERRVRGELPDD